MFCSGCLSMDRNLSSPLDSLQYMFCKVCDVELKSKLLLCWECLAILKRIKKFKAKVYNSQWLLNNYSINQKINLQCQTNLIQTEVETCSVNPEVIEESKQISVKVENNENSDDDLILNSNSENFPSDIEDAPNGSNEIGITENKISLQNVRQNIANDYVFLKKLKGEAQYNFSDTFCKDFSNEIKHPPSELNEVLSKELKEHGVESDFKQFKFLKEIQYADTYEMFDGKKYSKKQRPFLRYFGEQIQSKVVKRISLSLEELLIWMDRERKSNLFLNANYKCEKCVIVFDQDNEYQKHNLQCHNSEIQDFICDICTASFPSKSKLKGHIKNHLHAYQCKVCSEKSFSKQIMIKHTEQYKVVIRCKHCQSYFLNTRHFFKHYKSLHEFYICDYCNKKKRSKKVLLRHITRHHQQYVCKPCDRQYKCLTTFRAHLALKHGTAEQEKRYCVQCDKTYDNDALFRRHLLTSVVHEKERAARREPKKYPCPDCGKVYTRKTYMNNHYAHVHAKRSKYYCHQCDKAFLNRTRHLEHQKYHHDGLKKDKNKLCNICGRGFAVNRTLQNHMRTHSGERPFQCSHCEATFAQKYGLYSHIKHVHLKNKRKVCWR